MGKLVKLSKFVFYYFILILGCTNQVNTNTVNINDAIVSAEVEKKVEVEIPVDPILERAKEIAAGMDDRLLAAQTLISGIDGRGRLQNYLAELLTEIPAGGIMLFSYNLNTDNDSIRNMLSQTKTVISAASGIAPFIAVDHEGGTVDRFQADVTSLPSAITYRDFYNKEGLEATLEKIKNDSYKDAVNINKLGVNMNFAPVAEQLTDYNRVFLARRSYGADPEFTALASFAFIQGMENAGILCVLKHFPGSAGIDPHYSKSSINLKGGELDELIYPFSYLIKNGAGALMVAHTLIPTLDSEIASLSPVVMSSWLRVGLKFKGIIISDDFLMAAAGGLGSENAAVKSIAAGSDMILVWPADLRKTHNAIITALENQTLPRDRLIDASQNIIYQKIKLGLMD